ncbi:MAG: zinc-ribbon domain-containing protein [Planctomycetales bacterium]|nr:zinc-ribbon domain-containing protein [Planctomycetales bacterium]
MIIFGFTHLNKTIGGGDFFCPQCRQPSSYRQRSSRQWFTLYFIPVVPAGRVTEIVECDACRTRYESNVLHYDPAAEFEKYLADLRRLVVGFLYEVGRCSAGDLSVARQQLSEVADRPLDPSLLVESLRQAADQDYLREIRQRTSDFTHEGRWTLVILIRRILESQQALSESESSYFLTIAKPLGIPKRHMQDFLRSDLDTATDNVLV